MPGQAYRITDGATLTAGTSAWTAQLTEISMDGISRTAVDITHLDLTAAGAGKWGEMLFAPADYVDPGSLNISGHYDPDDKPPIDAVPETWTIAFDLVAGDSTATSLAGSGFMTDFNWTGTLNDKVTFTATIKFSGNITITAAT